MTNYLAHDLRQVLADLEHPDVSSATLERLERIIERVEQVDADDASTELTASFVLEPDQEIRSDALDYAVQLATAEISFPATNVAEVLDLADTLAGWIRTGERPQ